MSLSRRGFLGLLLAAPVAGPLLELLPAAPPLQFTPKYYSVSVPISLDELNAVTLRAIMPGVSDAYFKSDPLLAYLQERPGRGAADPGFKNSPRWVD